MLYKSLILFSVGAYEISLPSESDFPVDHLLEIYVSVTQIDEDLPLNVTWVSMDEFVIDDSYFVLSTDFDPGIIAANNFTIYANYSRVLKLSTRFLNPDTYRMGFFVPEIMTEKAYVNLTVNYIPAVQECMLFKYIFNTGQEIETAKQFHRFSTIKLTPAYDWKDTYLYNFTCPKSAVSYILATFTVYEEISAVGNFYGFDLLNYFTVPTVGKKNQ